MSTQYHFLSQPPNATSQKPTKRVVPAALPAPAYSPPPVPGQPTNAMTSPTVVRRPSKSGTYAHIYAWAAQIQPGSPAPCSPPNRRPSLSSIHSRRPSLGRRRPSIGHGRAPSGSLGHLVHTRSVSATSATSPNSNPNAQYPDLVAMGYTSVFIQFDKTPTTPSPFRTRHPAPLTSSAVANIPIPPIPQDKPAKKKGVKRFRSLSILRSKKPAKVPVESPRKATHTRGQSNSSAAKAEICAATTAHRKRAHYAHVRPPPTLANELELMQFADGGSLEGHAKRLMEAQNKTMPGVAMANRDERGGMWLDEDEEIEYRHLLEGRDGDEEMDWEAFDGSAPANQNSLTSVAQHAMGSPSLPTPSSHSSLSPTALLPLPENEPASSFTRGQVNDRVLSSQRIGGTSMSVLSLPSRPRRKVGHLMREPGKAFLLGVEAFAPRSPKSPKGMGYSTPEPISMKNPRKRPAPLKLASSAHEMANAKVALVGIKKLRVTQAAEDQAPGKARMEFFEESFEPLKVSQPNLAVPPRYAPTSGTSPRRPTPVSTTTRKPVSSHKPLDVALVAPWTQIEPRPVARPSDLPDISKLPPKSVRILGLGPDAAKVRRR